MKAFFTTSLLIALLFFAGFAQAADTSTAKKIPFHGKLAAVDTAAQTITIAGKTPRVFHLTPATRITDGSGAPSTLAAAAMGEDCGGSYTKAADGAMTLYSLRLGSKPGSKAAAEDASAPSPSATPPPVKPTPFTPPSGPVTQESHPAGAAVAPPEPIASGPAMAKKQHFSGKVVSVDAAAGTLVVHGKTDQTFTVTSATKMTGATALSDVAVGAKVSGTYVKSADDATMTVSTLKVSK